MAGIKKKTLEFIDDTKIENVDYQKLRDKTERFKN